VAGGLLYLASASFQYIPQYPLPPPVLCPKGKQETAHSMPNINRGRRQGTPLILTLRSVCVSWYTSRIRRHYANGKKRRSGYESQEGAYSLSVFGARNGGSNLHRRRHQSRPAPSLLATRQSPPDQRGEKRAGKGKNRR